MRSVPPRLGARVPATGVGVPLAAVPTGADVGLVASPQPMSAAPARPAAPAIPARSADRRENVPPPPDQYPDSLTLALPDEHRSPPTACVPSIRMHTIRRMERMFSVPRGDPQRREDC